MDLVAVSDQHIQPIQHSDLCLNPVNLEDAVVDDRRQSGPEAEDFAVGKVDRLIDADRQ